MITGEHPVRRVGRLTWSAVRRGADYFPLTPLGLLVVIGAAGALRLLAYAQMDLVWLVVGYAALVGTAATTLAVIVGAIWIKIRTRAAPENPADIERHTMETRLWQSSGFTSPTLFWLPFAQVHWSWERPLNAEMKIEKKRWRLRERVRLEDRGHVAGIRRRIVIQDSLGLARLAIRQDDPRELTVYPHVFGLGSTPMLVSLCGGDERPHPMGIDDGDRVELRRYVPGDPARFINWKVFGRTRKLVVRVPERALSPARRTVAYLVAGPDDDASAAAARAAVSSHVLGDDWTFSADGTRDDAKEKGEALELIVRSVAARPDGGVGLEGFLRRAERTGPVSAVVFVPGRQGPWLAKVARAIGPRAARSRFVIATDGIDRTTRWPKWTRLFARAAVRPGIPEADLDYVIGILSATGAEVMLLDRRTGRRLGARHRAAWKLARDNRRRAAA